jgi:hypothetical protein
LESCNSKKKTSLLNLSKAATVVYKGATVTLVTALYVPPSKIPGEAIDTLTFTLTASLMVGPPAPVPLVPLVTELKAPALPLVNPAVCTPFLI